MALGLEIPVGAEAQGVLTYISSDGTVCVLDTFALVISGWRVEPESMQIAQKPSSLARAQADILIPGKGGPIANGVVVWKGNTIVYVGAQDNLPEEYCTLPYSEHRVIMPGMWDCHIHYLGATSVMMETFTTTSQSLAGARSVPDLRNTVMAGFTSVREVGGYGCELAKAVKEGAIMGPTIYSSHSAISMTAGHGDIHNVHLEGFKDLCAHGLPFTIADGVDECIKAVRLQLRRGARVIKVCASGGVVSELDDPRHQEYSLEELKAIVDEARRVERVVAAHCHGKAGIMAALEAGCATIEHGSYLDEEAIDIMVKKGVLLVATRSILEGGLESPELFSPGSYAKLVQIADSHAQAYALAAKKGVRIALGTDMALSGRSGALSYGSNGREVVFAVDAGLSPLQAIEAATANGPLTIGPQAPLSGQLREGYEADMIALTHNPLDDVKVLADANNVSHVWQQGKLIKSP